MNTNDVVRLMTGTGGGYGDSKERPAAQVAMDVKNDYFTVEEAREHFLVEVDPETYNYKELPGR